MYGGPHRVEPPKKQEPGFVDRVNRGIDKYITKGYSRVVGAAKYIGKVEKERNKYMKVQQSLARSGVKQHAHDIAASSLKAEKRKMPRT